MRPDSEDEAAGCWFYTGAVVLAHEGKESRLNMTRPQLLMARLMQPIPRMFITAPALAMSDTLRIPYEKTMALGGVATGSMKAKEALSVQGIITYRGFRLIDWHMEARTGRKSVAVATLLAHSVKVAMRRQRMTAMAQGGMEWSGVI